MLQISLGVPEVVLWAIALEPHQVFWSFVGANQSVCNDVFHLKLFLIVHQLLWWGLMSGPDLWRAGVLGLQVFHILKVCVSG